MTTTYFALHPARFRLDGGAMYGIIPKPLWEKVSPPDEHNRIDMSLRCLLIVTESKKIILDTGIGDYHGEKFNEMFDVRGEKNPLAECLKDLGISTEEITDLVLSHLHFDHAGGMGSLCEGKMQPVFPNATLHLHKDHFEYGQHPTLRDKGSFHTHYYGPVIEKYKSLEKIHWLTGSEGEILDYGNGEKLNFLMSNGHTPYLLHPFDKKFIYLADIIPTSNHVHIPWVMGYDLMPGVTTEDKQRILTRVINDDLTVIFEHDILYWGTKITKNEKNQFKAKNLQSADNAKTQKIEL